MNRGLMYRQSLGSGSGMLFLIGNGYHTFTMVNMNFPLDIIFIDTGLKIVNIAANAQPGTSSVPSGAVCAYVLEVNAGQCAANGITTGNRIRIGPYSDPATPTPSPTPTPTPTPTVKPTATPNATISPTPTVKPSGTPTPTISPTGSPVKGTIKQATPTPAPTPRPLLALNVSSRPGFPAIVTGNNSSVTPTLWASVTPSPAALSAIIVPASAQSEDGSIPDQADISTLAGLDLFLICAGLFAVGIVRWQLKK